MPRLALLLLLLATVRVGPRVPCAEHGLEIARAQLEFFQDPSDAKRRQLSERLSQRAAGVPACAGDLEYVTDDDWPPSYLDPSRAPKLLREARVRCKNPDNIDLRDEPTSGSCTVEHVRQLVHAGDNLAKPIVDRDHHWSVERRWLGLFEVHPDRDERLLAALAGSSCAPDAAPFRERVDPSDDPFCVPMESYERDGREDFRDRAIQELIGPPDPRAWVPRDVALVVKAAQNLDALIDWQKAEFRRRNPRVISIGGLQKNEYLLLSYFRRLLRMGFANMSRLGFPHKNLRLQAGDNAHFPLEPFLYRAEWAGTVADFPTYANGRWQETDAKAPHPDLEAVKAALAELERNASEP